MTRRILLSAIMVSLGGGVAWSLGQHGQVGRRAHVPPGRVPGASERPDPPADVASWQRVEDFSTSIAVFETVFWEPQDTASLRARIRNTGLVEGKTVLEIGTGSGLLSLCCLKAGAEKVVATDVNPLAIANARYNAQLLGVDDRLDLRLVPTDDADAYSVIADSERFDVVISNPPWLNQTPERIEEYAFFDPDFKLLRSLLAGLRDHLKPGGRALLTYGCVDAIQTARKIAHEQGMEVIVVDHRPPGSQPEVFLPGMLLEVVP